MNKQTEYVAKILINSFHLENAGDQFEKYTTLLATYFKYSSKIFFWLYLVWSSIPASLVNLLIQAHLIDFWYNLLIKIYN